MQRFARSDRGVFFIVGEAGAGKTRMAVECTRQCAQRGAVVLAGLGCDFEGTAPYTPFVDAWTDVRRILGSAGDNPFFQSVERSIQQLAGSGRACILIEDLHQADESSLHLFHHLARAARRLPLQLIGTLREEEIQAGSPLHALMASLARERWATRSNLERLEVAATAELIGDLWGEMPARSVAETVRNLTGGNPFYTEEVAAALREAPQGSSFAPSSDLVETMRDRVARIGPQTERLLVAASVQGVRFDFDIARMAADLEHARALDALDAALQARVVEEQDGMYVAKGYEMLALACHSLGEWKRGREYEEQRRSVTDGTLDVASAFDVHL